MSTFGGDAAAAAAVASASHSVITQVSAHSGGALFSHDQLQAGSAGDSAITLNLRGHKFNMMREELMALPESVLLCLFPNGVFIDGQGNMVTSITGTDVITVDFSPLCLQYVLDTFRGIATSIPSSPTTSPPGSPRSPEVNTTSPAAILAARPAVIILQEDLDFYVVPPPTIAHKPYPPNYADMVSLKLGVSKRLLAERGIFSALKRARAVSSDDLPDQDHLPHGETPDHLKAAGSAEKHLLEMLCASGFDIADEWGHREREPSKTVISSLALVRLQATEPASAAAAGDAADPSSVTINPMAQKLLLFWRKPARKCWWDRICLKGIEGFDPEVEVKVHVRRMWTLELSVIGVH
ncbi:hypothetical protein BZA70DRAFT_241610 [Myxozyma melibiosi]|uniref:Uncharacterized protein n=1 Tax=Myxozyma melibiosi TaxID=54550 RepID=A0ABR1EZX8_9ASCO